MFHEYLLGQILDLPDAPLLIQEVSNKLNEERVRREKFYNDIDDSQKVEFINGEIVVHSPVTKKHNQATGLLFQLLNIYCHKYSLGFVGIEKIMTVFTRNDYEPDLVFFGNTKAQTFKPEQTLFPVPDFVVEVLSKSTAKQDRGLKFNDYETHQVAEYWIIDPDTETVEQYLLQDNRYYLQLKSTNGTIKSHVIQGFEIPIRAIFEVSTNVETLQVLMNS
ncbi:MAG: Uma2 family endonuclease [Spirosomataceae bacterium]